LAEIGHVKTGYEHMRFHKICTRFNWFLHKLCTRFVYGFQVSVDANRILKSDKEIAETK